MPIINRALFLALLALSVVLDATAFATPASANVDPGQLITVTGPSNPNPTLYTYIYQWEVHQGSPQGTDITSSLQKNGVMAPTNGMTFEFDAPIYNAETSLYIKLSVYAVKHGGSINDALGGCSDSTSTTRTINAAGCGLISGPADGASMCSGTSAEPGTASYSYTGTTTRLGFQWYFGQTNPPTTPISGATSSSVIITLASGSPLSPYMGQYYVALGVSKTGGTGENYEEQTICTRGLNPVPKPTASIA